MRLMYHSRPCIIPCALSISFLPETPLSPVNTRTLEVGHEKPPDGVKQSINVDKRLGEGGQGPAALRPFTRGNVANQPCFII